VTRYVCVHGHFYQPPRENPWLEVVEQQDAAYPFHDWNERITAECYAPNARARVLDGDGRIAWLVNNYARLSFDVGPTLLAWMQDAAPETYAGILEADRRSTDRFGGHGSAMAQAHSHAILPLSNERDRRTEVRWGIADFRHRYGRDPEGMWLPETAVDDATLDLLAEHGIRFTVLSPYQAARVREPGAAEWTEVDAVDTTVPYLVHLPGGRSITVFFYDGDIARGVAFEGLLDSAEAFEQRLAAGFTDREGPQLVHVATDGESYGHHHRHGEMGLAATLHRLAGREDLEVTNYAQFLALHPPIHEAEVVQASSWSCAHGVERWRSDCGCASESGRHQRWRAPLREALEWLRDELAGRFETLAEGLLSDPWAARDDYIDVVLDRDGNLGAFLERHAVRPLEDDEVSRVLRLLEMQRHSLLMFTSCGWFFEEIGRLEPVQVLRYAARAIQLSRVLTGHDDLEGAFQARLAAAPSNDPSLRDGAGIYDKLVRPGVTDLEQVAAHFAISSLFWRYGESEHIGAYEVLRDDYHLRESGRAKLAFGGLTIRSTVTRSRTHVEFAALHLGDHNFACGVRPRATGGDYARLGRELEQLFDTADVPGLIRAIDDHFEGEGYSLRTLFRDEQHRILETVLAETLAETEGAYRVIYRGRAPLMRYLADLGTQLPRPLRRAAEVVLNADLRIELARPDLAPDRVRDLLEEAGRFEVELDDEGLAHTLSATVAELAARTAAHVFAAHEDLTTFESEHVATLDRIHALIEVVGIVPFEVDLSPPQEVPWRLLHEHETSLLARADAGDEIATRWCEELGLVAAVVGVASSLARDRPGRTDTVETVPSVSG
jgi:alpha-amylase/alpha-mannosidase (GH57 family)